MLALTIVLGALPGLAAAPPALASPPTVTLTGATTDGTTPDGDRHRVTGVRATLSEGVAGGYLETEGKAGDVGGPWDGFQGTVTCMTLQGDDVVVGALGTAWHLAEEEGAQRKTLPGQYVQILSVRFGDFASEDPFEPPLPAAFTMLGEDDEGVPGSTPPDCSTALFTPLFTATNGVLHISPAITSPLDGATASGGKVALSGTAERGAVLAVYDTGDTSRSVVVTADDEGHWTATIGGLDPGPHTFAAFVRPGSDISSNTVQVEVLPADQTSDGADTNTKTTATTTPTTGQGVLSVQEGHPAPHIPYAKLASTSVVVARDGTLEISVSCPTGETSCSGTITLRTLGAFSATTGGAAGPTGRASTMRLAIGSFRVAGGHVRSIRLRLSGKGRALLARRRRLPSRATIVARDPAGATHTTQATLTLRAGRR
jgi:hypothetical protein